MVFLADLPHMHKSRQIKCPPKLYYDYRLLYILVFFLPLSDTRNVSGIRMHIRITRTGIFFISFNSCPLLYLIAGLERYRTLSSDGVCACLLDYPSEAIS